MKGLVAAGAAFGIGKVPTAVEPVSAEPAQVVRYPADPKNLVTDVWCCANGFTRVHRPVFVHPVTVRGAATGTSDLRAAKMFMRTVS